MQDAFILSACRTPIGRFQGVFASVPATELAAISIHEAVTRAHLSFAAIDEVILGHVLTTGVGQAPARQAALAAGLPVTVAAYTVNKVCGSGLKAVMLAVQAIRCGEANVIVAGGMENMSRSPWVLARNSPPLGDRVLVDSLMHDALVCSFSGCSMGAIAEQLADKAGIGRSDQDRYALESHRRALEATQAGVFTSEIVPVTTGHESAQVTIRSDSGPRSDSTLERLAALSPAFRDDGTITAGNASMLSDGAAAVVVGNRSACDRSSQTPLGRVVAAATSGGKPSDVFTAPVEAILEVVHKSGHALSDIDLFEINEAFAVEMIACIDQLALPSDRVNIHGGAIALGHPIGASGARVLVTLLHALKHRGARLGIAALCLGGGNAVAMLVDRDV